VTVVDAGDFDRFIKGELEGIGRDD
jgi:hypothetical protein